MDKSFQKNDTAVSPVIGAILMLAIGVTILTTVQLNFIPVWNTQEELDHIQKMFGDIKELKSGIDSTIQSGTTSSLPIIMGFKYSSKFLVYNPKDSAFVSLDIKEDTWAEVRYNEMFPDGMTDETSIKNVTTSTITYALKGSQLYNSFIYEHGIIRRSGSNYTASSQVAIANGNIYLLSVKPLFPESTSGVEMRTMNIYPTSQQKNSVIGKNVWLILHTKPEYVNWWNDNIRKGGGDVKLANNTTGIIIAYVNTAVIKMGEVYLSTTSRASPEHAPPYRVVKIMPDNTYLPVDGITTLVAQVQDKYNNPVPNVQVSFSINNSRIPANAFATAQLLQSSARSDVDGKASVSLKTGGAGFYYIDASVPGSSTTFVYPASSQGGVLSLSQTGSGPEYIITATLRDSFGGYNSTPIWFDANDGDLLKINDASTILNVTNTTRMSITNIQASNITNNSASITWDTPNHIIVSAKSGYLFNSIRVPTMVNTTGCVQYGTSSGSYLSTSCDGNGSVSSHSVYLAGLLPSTAYYFKVNSSKAGANVESTEYMFVTHSGSLDTTPGTHNYTYVTGNTISNGMISNWPNMRNASDGGAFTTLTEGTNISSTQYKWSYVTNNDSWRQNYTTTGGSVSMDFTSGDGNPAGSIYSKLIGDNSAKYSATTTWTSPNFTWTNGTPFSAKLYFDWKVETYSNTDPGSYYMILVRPDNSTSQIYPTTEINATEAWSTKSSTILANNFTQTGNYSLKFVSTLNTKKAGGGHTTEIRFDNPTITLNKTSYTLNITTNTTSVPVDTNYYLEMNYSVDSNDTYSVYVFNGTAWNYRGSLSSVPWTLFNISLSNQEYNGGTSNIRYIDNNPSGTTQGNLKIDYQRIHGYTS